MHAFIQDMEELITVKAVVFIGCFSLHLALAITHKFINQNQMKTCFSLC